MAHKTTPNRLDLDAIAWKLIEALQRDGDLEDVPDSRDNIVRQSFGEVRGPRQPVQHPDIDACTATRHGEADDFGG